MFDFDLSNSDYLFVKHDEITHYLFVVMIMSEKPFFEFNLFINDIKILS